MPVISGGGGGGGNTTAQVVASGKVLPVADAAGVTVDTTTYADTIKGGGAKLTTLVFPADQGALAIALIGDAFPRWVLAADALDGLFFGDGTADPLLGAQGFFTTSGAGFGGLRVPTAQTASSAAQLGQLTPYLTINSGALPTVQLVSGTGHQLSVGGRDIETITPCTFNPGAATTATVTVALSPDNITYSTLGIETEPVGVALDGTIHLIKVRVPTSWYLKLTVNAQAVLGLTTYY